MMFSTQYLSLWPGPPPNLSRSGKWAQWLFEAGMNPEVDSLAVVGGVH